MPISLIRKWPNSRVPVKVWTEDIEQEALDQLQNISQLPFIHSHVAAMPDVHWGKGSTVGSVIATRHAVIPAAVGVDIGCGMMALCLDLKATQLPDSLAAIRTAIEKAVPHGRTDNGGRNDRGAWGSQVPYDVSTRYNQLCLGLAGLVMRSKDTEKALGRASERAINHLGTLGTGNHFIEICLDKADNVWVMLHSGSRGIGNKIGSYYIEKAKEEMERWHIELPDKDLAFLPEGTDLFDDYVNAVGWAQGFAAANREVMMAATLSALTKELGKELKATQVAINCHHNYVAREHHFGENVLVTRKGAVRAREGDLGIIPGSMGARSFIVRGKGNADSFHSCSHGAGRKMSRRAAEKQFSLEDLEQQTKGIECRKDAGVIDEIPSAYKPIDQVMSNQSDLVEVVAELRQIICVKG
jgi:tRNA-splicing ligase RtcB